MSGSTMVWTAWNAPKIEIMALVLKHCDLFIAENRKLLPSYRNKPAQMIKTGKINSSQNSYLPKFRITFWTKKSVLLKDTVVDE